MRIFSNKIFADSLEVCAAANDAALDPVVQQTLAGHLCVAAVAAIECSLRSAYIEFSGNNSRSFEIFVSKQFEKFNARVRFQQINDDFSGRIEEKYQRTWGRYRKAITRKYLAAAGTDPFSDYSNLVFWRHKFVHDQTRPPATVSDVVRAAVSSEIVLECFCRALKVD